MSKSITSGLQGEEKFPETPKEIQQASKQLEVAKIEKQFRYTKDSLVKPELALENLVKLFKQNYAHFFCVTIKASCVSGVGYKFVARKFNEQEVQMKIATFEKRQNGDDKENSEPLTPEEVTELADLKTKLEKHLADKELLDDLFENINPEDSFNQINYQTDIDKEAIGFSCWEIIRDGKQRITEIYHMPAVTVRMLSNNIGVCQIRTTTNGGYANSYLEGGTFKPQSRVFFKKIGTPVVMDSETGRVCGIISNPGPSQTIKWINADGKEDDKAFIPESQRANEVIIQRKYNPDYFWYGMPDIVAALDACSGDKAAAEFQEQFFDNNAVPRMAVILTGMEMDEDLSNEIQGYFTEDIRGNAHSTLVIEVAGEEIDGNGQKIAAGDIKFEKLATEVTDASFRDYRKDNCDKIVTVHRVPGSLLPIQGTNFTKDTSSIELEIFKSQVIRPLQAQREFFINKYIIRESHGINTWEFKFNEIDSLDELRKMQINQGYIGKNIMTINEVRRELGLPAKKGGDTLFQITPLGLVKIEDIEDLSTGDLSARPDAPLSGEDGGSNDGGRPESDDKDKAAADKSDVDIVNKAMKNITQGLK